MESQGVAGDQKSSGKAEIRQALPRNPSAPAGARALVRQLLAPYQVDPEVIDSSSLVASELVTNALKHGRGAVNLMLKLRGSRVLIEVVDEGHHPEHVRRRQAGPDGGWGLHLVDALSVRWGVYEGTTHVWAEVDL